MNGLFGVRSLWNNIKMKYFRFCIYYFSKALYYIGLIVVLIFGLYAFVTKSCLIGWQSDCALIGAIMTGTGAIGELTFIEEAGYSNSMTEEDFYQTYCLRCSTKLCKSIKECPHRFELEDYRDEEIS